MSNFYGVNPDGFLFDIETGDASPVRLHPVLHNVLAFDYVQRHMKCPVCGHVFDFAPYPNPYPTLPNADPASCPCGWTGVVDQLIPRWY